MSGKSKLTLILELKNRLFNSKLAKTKANFNKTTNSMRGKIRKLKGEHIQAFKAMASESAGFGRVMGLIGNPYALVAAGLVAVIGLFAEGVKQEKLFTKEFLQIKNLNLDKQERDLRNYKELIRDTAFVTGQDLAKSAIAYYDLQSATGLYGKKADTVFRAVAKYSTATGADLNDTINATTKAMKAFNLEANQTQMLLESNVKTVATGIVTFDQLAKVQTQFGGSAGNIGQAVDTANKLFAVFTSIGGSAAEASTLTKTFFQGLGRRGAQIEKHLKVNVFDEEGNFRQADQILRDIGKRFEHLSQKQVADLIAKIGGTDGLNQLLMQMKGNAKAVTDTFENFDNSKFNLDKALANAKGDATVLTQLFKNRLNNLLSRLGTVVLPIVIRALEMMNRNLDMYLLAWKAGVIIVNKFKAHILGTHAVVMKLFERLKAIAEVIKGIVSADFDRVKAGKKAFKDANKQSLKQAYKTTYNFVLKDLNSKLKDDKDNNVLGLGANTDDGNGGGLGSGAGEQINSVTSKASQPRSITVHIDALNKGGINTTTTTLANKSAEEIEQWFNEAMLRVIRNVELSNG